MAEPARRILFASDSIEPNRGGSTVVNARLLSKVGTDLDLTIATTQSLAEGTTFAGRPVVGLGGNWSASRWLPGRVRVRLLGRSLSEAVRRYRALFRRYRPDLVVAQFPLSMGFAAGILAAEEEGIRWGGWLHDMLVESRPEGWERETAERVWKRIEPGRNFAVLSDAMAEEYRARHRVDPPVINHIVGDLPDSRPAGNPNEILFCGGIYRINLESMKRLARIVSRRPGWRLTILTQTPAPVLERNGISGPSIRIDYRLGDEAFREALGRAAVLFSGLDFHREGMGVDREEIRSILPTKLTDYCCYARPILAWCPSDYNLARLLRESGAGMVVDQDSDDALEAALASLLDDPEVHAEWSERAARLRPRFSAERAVGVFRECVGRWLEGRATAEVVS